MRQLGITFGLTMLLYTSLLSGRLKDKHETTAVRIAREYDDITHDSFPFNDSVHLERLIKAGTGDAYTYETLRLSVYDETISPEHSWAMAEAREQLITELVKGISQQENIRIARYKLPVVSEGIETPVTQYLYAYSLNSQGQWQRAQELDQRLVALFFRQWHEQHHSLPLKALGIETLPGGTRMPDPRLMRSTVFQQVDEAKENRESITRVPQKERASITTSLQIFFPDEEQQKNDFSIVKQEILAHLTVSPSYIPLQRKQAAAAAMQVLLDLGDTQDKQTLGKVHLACWENSLTLFHLVMLRHLGHDGFWRQYNRFSKVDRRMINEGLLSQLLGASFSDQVELHKNHQALEISLQLVEESPSQENLHPRRLFGPLALWLLNLEEAEAIGFVPNDFDNPHKRRAWIDRLSNEQLQHAKDVYLQLVPTFITKVFHHVMGKPAPDLLTASTSEKIAMIKEFFPDSPQVQQAVDMDQIQTALDWLGLGSPSSRIETKAHVLSDKETEPLLWIHTVDLPSSSLEPTLVVRIMQEEEVYDILEGHVADTQSYPASTWDAYLQFQAKNGSRLEGSHPMRLGVISLKNRTGEILAQETTLLGDSSNPIHILSNGPWKGGYLLSSACRTKAQVRLQSEDIIKLLPGDRLRLWLQWSPTLEGPWKTRARGEVRKDAKGVLRARGGVALDDAGEGIVTLDVGSLAYARWPTGTTPYFRIAQAIKRPGEEWLRVPKRSLSPEDNNAVYALPFQAAFAIVYIAENANDLAQHGWDTVDLSSRSTSAHINRSFTESFSSYHPFSIGFGGTNHASMVPAQEFVVNLGHQSWKLWSHYGEPKGYRQPGIVPSPAWGVCPIHVPLPPTGKSVTLTIATHFYGREYTKHYTVLGPEPSPKNLESQRLDEQRYQQWTKVNATQPANSETLQVLYQQALQHYHEDANETTIIALSQAYLPLLSTEQAAVEASQHEIWSKTDTCASQLRKAALAMHLQKWSTAVEHLELALEKREQLLCRGQITELESYQLLVTPLAVKSREPFATGVIQIYWLDLWKQLAWTLYDPILYEQALQLKTAAHQQISPLEYQELATLVVAKTGDKVKASLIWQQGEALYHDPSSPYFNASIRESSLIGLRPGWWPSS